MDNGMITLHNNDDTRPRRKYGTIKLKVKKPWEVSTGHKEHRDTIMDNRPKRQRTRKAIDRSWQQEYDM
jgi:hypothetical protein